MSTTRSGEVVGVGLKCDEKIPAPRHTLLRRWFDVWFNAFIEARMRKTYFQIAEHLHCLPEDVLKLIPEDVLRRVRYRRREPR